MLTIMPEAVEITHVLHAIGRSEKGADEKLLPLEHAVPGLKWLREEDIRENRIVPIWLKGVPFAGCLSTRRHGPAEGM